MAENKQQPKMILWVVWGALLASLGIYGVVGHIMASQPPGPNQQSPENLQMMTIIFVIVSVAMVPLIPFLRRLLFFKPLAEKAFDDIATMRGSYFTISILSWSLAEAIAIYGFVLTFLSKEIVYYPAFAVPAALVMIAFRPNVPDYTPPDDADEGGDDNETDSAQHW